MRPINLSQEQKDKLLEMCRILFFEFNLGGNFYFNTHLNLPGEYESSIDELSEVDTGFIAYYCFGQKLLPNESAEDHMLKWFGEIHWFEFCIKYLIPKLSNSIQSTVDMRILFCELPNPVDYLYEHFKKLK